MEFIDENKRIKNIDSLKISNFITAPNRTKKIGGVVGKVTEVRGMIVRMLNSNNISVSTKPNTITKKYPPITIQQLSKITQGWTHDELYSIYRTSIEFQKNPAALFWIKYKEFKKNNGEKIKARINKRLLRKNGKEGRENQQEKRQSLFQ